jgi:hypothetical protein
MYAVAAQNYEKKERKPAQRQQQSGSSKRRQSIPARLINYIKQQFNPEKEGKW